jgi:hypothetical protein
MPSKSCWMFILPAEHGAELPEACGFGCADVGPVRAALARCDSQHYLVIH